MVLVRTLFKIIFETLSVTPEEIVKEQVLNDQLVNNCRRQQIL